MCCFGEAFTAVSRWPSPWVLNRTSPYRDQILAMTFGVVAFSIVVQGLTIQPLMRKLGVEMGREDEYDRTKVRQMALSAAITELEALRDRYVISASVYAGLRSELDSQMNEVHTLIDSMQVGDQARAAEEVRLARAEMFTAEKTAIQRAVNEGLISQHTAETMLARADDELDQLMGGGSGH